MSFTCCCCFSRIQSVPATVIYFTIYDNIKYALGYREADANTKYIPIFAGSSARGQWLLLIFNMCSLIGSFMSYLTLYYLLDQCFSTGDSTKNLRVPPVASKGSAKLNRETGTAATRHVFGL